MTENASGTFANHPALEAGGQAPPIGPHLGGDHGGWPRFAELEQSADYLPTLNMPPVMTLARDRWERLVTTLDIAQPPNEVWQALTDPERLKRWLAVCHGSLEITGRDCTLDFEDGEFFLCRPLRVEPATELKYLWRWLGIGQATVVTWKLEPIARSNGNGFSPSNNGHDRWTRVTVVEEAINPPWDWQTWNGGGWPGILNQLSAHLRTGTTWRWPWRRMGPYAQIELPISLYEAWDLLFGVGGLKYWMLAMHGNIAPGAVLPVMMGDASGMVEMHVREVVQPGERPPSFLPHVTFALKRPAWNCEVPGRIWLEPAGWGRSLLQVFHANWENLPAPLQLSERRLLSGFWAEAVQRAAMLCGRASQGGSTATAPHTWGAGPAAAPAAHPGTDAPSWLTGLPAGVPGGPIDQGPHGSAPPAFAAEMMKTGAFLAKVTNDMSGAMVAMLCLLGDRLGLFKDLAVRGPATYREFAGRTRISERYAREWLTALSSAQYIDYDSSLGRFSLPPERIPVLAEENGLMFMGGAFQQLRGLSAPLDELTRAFRSGSGVPQDAYPADLRDGMERMSAGWFNHLLVPFWIGMMPEVRTTLERGARVADVGCGAGRALLQLASAFPASQFAGYDAFAPAIAQAEANAREAGTGNRVRFEVHDVARGFPEDQLDLVTMFDSLHDIGDPVTVLTATRRALAPGGALLILEIQSADRLEDNRGPMATLLLGTGLFYNTPVALARGGNDLGLLGFNETVIRRLCLEAGFTSVRRVPIENPINALYEVRF